MICVTCRFVSVYFSQRASFPGSLMFSNSKINKMKLNKKAFALSTGIILGLAVLVITLIFVIFSYEGRQLVKLRGLFCGYSVTWWGAFIGLVWGMIYGVLGGWLFAWFYNKLEK